MRMVSRIAGLETIVKGYLIGHGLAVGALLTLAIVDFADAATAAPKAAFWAAIAVLSLAWVGQLAALAMGAGVVQTLRASLPAQFVSTMMVVVGTHGRYDVGYLLALIAPLFYVTVTRSRSAWAVGGLSAVAYMGAHGVLILLGVEHDPGVTLSVILKGGAVVYLSVALSYGVSRQALREDEIRKANLANEDLNRQLQRRLTELHAIAEITEVIHSSLDFDAVGPVVIDVLQKVMGLPSCSLFVLDRSKSETLFSATKQGPGARVLPAPQPLFDLGAGQSAVDGHFTCTSVFDHNSMMVVLCADSEALDALTAEDRLVLNAVASELVVAVENSQLYKLTRRLAITDELTSLHNYRYLQQRLDEEIERARRYGKNLSLVMLDVDDFKGVNDAHGHIVGDAVLAELGAVVKRCVREVDVVARYGGEEFSVILPETDASGAYVVAEKIREAVSAHDFCDSGGVATVNLTISLGVSCYPEHAHDKETLLRQADDALYRAKNTGKDRVRSPMSGSGAPPEAAGEGQEA